MCTKTSFAPLSGWMNPKPLVGLKNFTVPMVDIVSSQCWRGRPQPRAASKEQVGEDRENQPRTTDKPKAHSTTALYAQIPLRGELSHRAWPGRHHTFFRVSSAQ